VCYHLTVTREKAIAVPLDPGGDATTHQFAEAVLNAL
jgi:hypothetical protein